MKEKLMKMKTMYFSDKEITELTRIADEKGITFSELVRRILDEYIEKKAE